MKKINSLMLGCGLLLVFSSCSINNAVLEDNSSEIEGSIEETSGNEDIKVTPEVNDFAKGGFVIKNLPLSVPDTIKTGKIYTQSAINSSSNRILRLYTPVWGDVSSVNYTISIEGYSDSPITKEVTNLYKGVEVEKGVTKYYDGTNLVDEESNSTNLWYFACYTIEYSTPKYYESKVNANIIINGDYGTKLEQELGNSISLKDTITSKSLDTSLINNWTSDNNEVTISDNSLTINGIELTYYDGFDNNYIFTDGTNYVKVTNDNGSLVINGVVNETRINNEIVKNLIECPIQFSVEPGTKFEQETSENIIITIPDGVTYEAHYEKEEKYYSSYEDGLPDEVGTYALVVTTTENDTYKSTTKWVVINIIEKVSENKITPVITFDFEAGTTFYKGETPTYKIVDENGNEITDADVSVNYTSDTGYNSIVFPSEVGDYGITVTVNSSDKYNAISKNVWFRLSSEIKTTVSSNVDTIYTADGEINSKLENIIDGDESTSCWFGTNFNEGDYIMLSYSAPKKLNKLSFVLADNGASSDYFKFKVQYLNSSNEWIDLSEEIDKYSQILSFNTIETKAIRLITTSSTGSWNKVNEIKAYYVEGLNVINNGFTFVSASNDDINSLADNNLDTYVWFDWHYTSSCNIVLDYEKNITVNTIKFLTGCSDHPYDNAENVNFKFSYSLDGINYTDIDGEYKGINILVELDTPIEARYIKTTPILDGESSSGITIREFGVNLDKFVVNVTFGEETGFEYDGEHHAPSYSVPYGVPYNVVYNSDDLGLYNQTEAVDKAYWAIVVSQQDDEVCNKIYTLSGKLYQVYTII